MMFRSRQWTARIVAGVAALAVVMTATAATASVRLDHDASAEQADVRDKSWERAFRHNLARVPEACAESSPSGTSAADLRTSVAPGPTTWTHNIAGVFINQGRLCAVNPLIFAIASQPNNPLAIGIQEACRTQANHLLRWLQQHKNENYRMEFRTQDPAIGACRDPDTGNTDFGSAVYAIGKRAPGSGDEHPWEGTYDHQAPGDGEKRGWTCIRSVFPYSACTSHMTYVGPDDGEARAQAKEMFEVKKEILDLTGEPVFWGGDFYMTPRGMSDVLGADFFKEQPEGDIFCRNSTVRDTTYNGEPERKIDYVFKTRPVDCSPSSGPDKDAVVWPDVPPAECRGACLNYDHKMVGGFL